MSVNQNAVFVDSNIWLYIFLPGQNHDKAELATQLIAQFAGRIVVSTQVINETVRTIRYNNVMSEPRIRDLINSFHQDYEIVQMNRAIQIRASHLRENYSFSYWDSLLVSAALDVNIQSLFSEDMQHELIVENQLTIFNPFASNQLAVR
jgi:predicted nucleic acid-binding protein